VFSAPPVGRERFRDETPDIFVPDELPDPDRQLRFEAPEDITLPPLNECEYLCCISVTASGKLTVPGSCGISK